MAVPDKQVALALEYIWSEASRRAIRVPDVIHQLGRSRRFAEIHFKRIVGRTINEEIQSVRLERVCTLLKETNLPFREISLQCGFTRQNHLANLFRKKLKQSMSHYRAVTRTGLHP